MYTLTTSEIPGFDISKSGQFVDFWSQFYSYEVEAVDENGKKIDYFGELNSGGDLTETNVRRLLRWKDYRFLTDPQKGNGQRNPKVKRVLDHLAAINSFRKGHVATAEMQSTAEEVFESPSIVWRVFLLHIAKPHIYPIADQNVFRVYSLHTRKPEPQTWGEYADYAEYFWDIAQEIGVPSLPTAIAEMKQVDNALFVFGQFIAAYYRSA